MADGIAGGKGDFPGGWSASRSCANPGKPAPRVGQNEPLVRLAAPGYLTPSPANPEIGARSCPSQERRSKGHSGNREEIFHIELASDQGSSAIENGIGPMGILPLKIWHFIDSRDDPIWGSPFLALDSSGRFQNKPASGSRLISKKSGRTSSPPTACGGRPMRLCQ